MHVQSTCKLEVLEVLRALRVLSISDFALLEPVAYVEGSYGCQQSVAIRDALHWLRNTE